MYINDIKFLNLNPDEINELNKNAASFYCSNSLRPSFIINFFSNNEKNTIKLLGNKSNDFIKKHFSLDKKKQEKLVNFCAEFLLKHMKINHCSSCTQNHSLNSKEIFNNFKKNIAFPSSFEKEFLKGMKKCVTQIDTVNNFDDFCELFSEKNADRKVSDKVEEESLINSFQIVLSEPSNLNGLGEFEKLEIIR
jgi:hypothetical protein